MKYLVASRDSWVTWTKIAQLMDHIQIPQDKLEVYNRLEKDLVRIVQTAFRIN